MPILLQKKIVRNFKHKKGKESRIKYAFKDIDYGKREKLYYLTSSVYIGNTIVHENMIFHGEPEDGNFMCKLESNNDHRNYDC